MVRFIIKFAGKVFHDVIISVLSLNFEFAHRSAVMGGQTHWYLFRRHTSHAICFGFTRGGGGGGGWVGGWVVVVVMMVVVVMGGGGGFTVAEVFHQYANTDVPVEWNDLSLK